jgi:hypothetical protein
MARLVRSLSDAASRTYESGPWYVKSVHATRRAFVTSGDVWFEVDRAEAARLLREGCSMTKPKRDSSKAFIARDTHEPLVVLGGYRIGQDGGIIREPAAPRTAGQDYGCDPLGDGTFRMVPSGDVVDLAERNRRLAGAPSWLI